MTLNAAFTKCKGVQVLSTPNAIKPRKIYQNEKKIHINLLLNKTNTFCEIISLFIVLLLHYMAYIEIFGFSLNDI